MHRIHLLFTALAALALVAALATINACGNEPPTPPVVTVQATLAHSDDDPRAGIFIDGEDTGHVTPHTFDDLDVGKEYEVSVELGGYVADMELLILGYGSVVTKTFDLSPDVGELTVTSTPADARISLNGIDTNEVTPFTFVDLASGHYIVTVTLPPYSPVPGSHDVEITAGSVDTVGFELVEEVGVLSVSSTPPGANILLDGEETGQVTPADLTLQVGNYSVAVALAGYSAPPPLDLTISADQTTNADFQLSVQSVERIILLEGFSNVYCQYCPQMNANVEAVMERPGYGTDRVLFVKWPAFLSPLDPFYFLTQTTTNARVASYFGSSTVNLPTLCIDGALLGTIGTPASTNAILTAIDAQPDDADLLITIAPQDNLNDVDLLSHSAQVTVRAVRPVDLNNHTIHVVLVYESVHCENTGYVGGIQDYHWVMRDHEMPATDLGVLTGGESLSWTVTLADPLGSEISGHAVFPTNKQIIAWVQNNATKAVIQAGSTITDHSASPASASSLPSTQHSQVHIGG